MSLIVAFLVALAAAPPPGKHPATWQPPAGGATATRPAKAPAAPHRRSQPPVKRQAPSAAKTLSAPEPADITDELEEIEQHGPDDGEPPPPPDSATTPPLAPDQVPTSPIIEFDDGTVDTANADAASADTPGAADPETAAPDTAAASNRSAATLQPVAKPPATAAAAGESQNSVMRSVAPDGSDNAGFGAQFGVGVAGVLMRTAKYAHVPDHSYRSLLASQMELIYAGRGPWTRWELLAQAAAYDVAGRDADGRTPLLTAFGPGARFGVSRGGFDWLLGGGYAWFSGDFAVTRSTDDTDSDAAGNDAARDREPQVDPPRQVGCGAIATTLRAPLLATGRVFYTLQAHMCGKAWTEATGYRDGVYAHVLGIEASG